MARGGVDPPVFKLRFLYATDWARRCWHKKSARQTTVQKDVSGQDLPQRESDGHKQRADAGTASVCGKATKGLNGS